MAKDTSTPGTSRGPAKTGRAAARKPRRATATKPGLTGGTPSLAARITEPEHEAASVIEAAGREAERIRRAAESDAARIRAEAEEHARRIVLDARASADGVRAEGMELVSNLREMSDVLRSNAHRLLHDIQQIHSRMVGELDHVDPKVDGTPEADDMGAQDVVERVAEGRRDPEARDVPDTHEPPPDRASDSSGGESLEIPDFVSRG